MKRCPSSPTATASQRAKPWRCTSGSGSPRACLPALHCTRCGYRRVPISTRNSSVKNEEGPNAELGASPGLRPGSDDRLTNPGRQPGDHGTTPVEKTPGSRRGRMLKESATVEEVPVWLEVNGEPMVTWMCTPDLL